MNLSGMVNQQKLRFLKKQFIPLLQQLDPSTKPRWGKMNVQQMIEHLVDTVMNASGKLKLPRVNEGERLKKFYEFMMSEKPFHENTKNPLMPEEPAPVKCHTSQAAIGKLQEELIYFFQAFENNPELITPNPFFGDLNFEENIQLLHKHAVHHLKQFGLEVY